MKVLTVNKKLEEAIERTLKDESDGDAAAIARTTTRWLGDGAVKALEKALELTRAGV